MLHAGADDDDDDRGKEHSEVDVVAQLCRCQIQHWMLNPEVVKLKTDVIAQLSSMMSLLLHWLCYHVECNKLCYHVEQINPCVVSRVVVGDALLFVVSLLLLFPRTSHDGGWPKAFPPSMEVPHPA